MRPRSLTEGSISRGLLLFALPILYGNILQSLNGSINAIWVGRFLGEAALTAAANANAILFLLLGGAFGLSMASTVLVGQYIGAGNLEAAKKVVGTSTTFFFAISILISATGWVFCEPLLTAMNTPADAFNTYTHNHSPDNVHSTHVMYNHITYTPNDSQPLLTTYSNTQHTHTPTDAEQITTHPTTTTHTHAQ